MECYFCEQEIKQSQLIYSYACQRCGHVYLTEECAEDIEGEKFKSDEKRIISIWIRNEYEKNSQKDFAESLGLENLHQIIDQYSPLGPLDKMDNALLRLDKLSSYVGKVLRIHVGNDYPYYHCFNGDELRNILILLSQEGLTKVPDTANPHNDLKISADGYKRLKDIKRPGMASRQCFVAMWFCLIPPQVTT